MPTPEEITNPLIAALQSRIAEAEAPVAELTADEQEEARAASEQSALARKYFSRDIISEARKMAEDELPKNRFLRALVGMGEGAAQYYNPKTFKSREDRAFDRLDKDFQRRGPVLQRDLAAYEGTAARNEQKRLDRQTKLQIADQKDRAEAQKLLLQNAKFLADDPVRKAKVEALISSSEFQKSKTKARDLENAFMAENGFKMGTATGKMTEAGARLGNRRLADQMDQDAYKSGLDKMLFGAGGSILKNAATPARSRTSSTSGSTRLVKLPDGTGAEVDFPGTTTTSTSGGGGMSEMGRSLLQNIFSRGAGAPGSEGGVAAALGLPPVPSGRAERGAGLSSPLTGLQSGTGGQSPGAGTPQTKFNTPLSSTEEQKFQQWKNKYAPLDSGEDYDLRGAFKAGVTPAANGHWPDTWKKPNHPTFSNESQYAKFGKPGSWDGERFIPPGAPVAPRRGVVPAPAPGGPVAAPGGGSRLTIRPIGGAAGKPLSGPQAQLASLVADSTASLDNSIDIMSSLDPETKQIFGKNMYTPGGNLLGLIPTQNWDYTHNQREGEIVEWSKSKDKNRQAAYQKYQQLTGNTAKQQWLEAIRVSGKAINQAEQSFIDRIMVSLSPNKKAIYDTPEQAMNKLIRQRLVTSALGLKMSLINSGQDQNFVQSINLSEDMEKAANRLLAKYKDGDKITAADFNPRESYPTLMKFAGDKLGPALGEGSGMAGSPPPQPTVPTAPTVEEKKAKFLERFKAARPKGSN